MLRSTTAQLSYVVRTRGAAVDLQDNGHIGKRHVSVQYFVCLQQYVLQYVVDVNLAIQYAAVSPPRYKKTEDYIKGNQFSLPACLSYDS